jgi:hypothetical protein
VIFAIDRIGSFSARIELRPTLPVLRQWHGQSDVQRWQVLCQQRVGVGLAISSTQTGSVSFGRLRASRVVISRRQPAPPLRNGVSQDHLISSYQPKSGHVDSRGY